MIRVHDDNLVDVQVTGPPREPWMVDKACTDVDPEIFFDRVNAEDAPAKKICGKCPVANDCLMFALLTEPPLETRYGWMGNMSPIDRTKLYRVLKGIKL